MKRLASVLVLATVIVVISQVVARPNLTQFNGIYTYETRDSLKFDNTNVARDTLIDVARSDTTQAFSVHGAQFAQLITKVFVEEGDQTDTVTVVADVSPDGGATWTGQRAIDTLLVTTADADSAFFYTDLIGSEVDNNMLVPLDAMPLVRVNYLSVSLANDDTLHVEPRKVITWQTQDP